MEKGERRLIGMLAAVQFTHIMDFMIVMPLGPQLMRVMHITPQQFGLLVSVYTMYRFDESYAVDVQKTFPGRFGVIKPVDSQDPKVGDTIDAWKKNPGAVAIRIMMTPEVPTDAADPGINRVLAAAGRNGFPVNLLARGRMKQVAELAKRNPNTQIVIDHLGLPQPFEPPTPPEKSSTRKRCPQCNAIYNSDLLAYCAHHIVPLVPVDDPIISEPPKSNLPLHC